MDNSNLAPSPFIGIALGAMIVLFRQKIAAFLEKSYKDLPQNRSIIEPYKLSYKIRPIFVMFIGLVISIFSILGLFLGK